ncbi:hypothetical protein [Staphylococcus cohnii]|uniref:hypothetical protein n=1 Tax=Staphylococcus cohnii TaxID=29382 RepID=UPI003CFB72EF
MVYEYERLIKKEMPFSGVSQELQEVYRKAKAYDKLVKLYPQKDEIPSDEFFVLMGCIIKERADDERS